MTWSGVSMAFTSTSMSLSWGRMHPDDSHLAETYIKTKWCSFNWETQDVVWERYWSVAQNSYWFRHRITEQHFFEDELEWTVHDSLTGRRYCNNALTGAWFWSDGYLPRNVWPSSLFALHHSKHCFDSSLQFNYFN